MSSSECDAEAVELAYSEYNYSGDVSGVSPPIIIAHCLLSNRKTWDKVASNLARQTGNVVYALDLRNHGSSPDHPSARVKDYLADLERFLKSKEISRGHFIGHSLGAKIQLQLAFKKPEMVASLVIVDYLPIDTPHSLTIYMKRVLRVLDEILEQLNESGVGNKEEAERYCQQEFKRLKIEPNSFRETLVTSLTLKAGLFEWDFKSNHLLDNGQHLMAADTEGKSYAGPVLILSPRNSIFVTPEQIERLSGILPNLTREIIPNVTHHLHMDDPETFLEKCELFWAKLKPAFN